MKNNIIEIMIIILTLHQGHYIVYEQNETFFSEFMYWSQVSEQSLEFNWKP